MYSVAVYNQWLKATCLDHVYNERGYVYNDSAL